MHVHDLHATILRLPGHRPHATDLQVSGAPFPPDGHGGTVIKKALEPRYQRARGKSPGSRLSASGEGYLRVKCALSTALYFRRYFQGESDEKS